MPGTMMSVVLFFGSMVTVYGTAWTIVSMENYIDRLVDAAVSMYSTPQKVDEPLALEAESWGRLLAYRNVQEVTQ